MKKISWLLAGASALLSGSAMAADLPSRTSAPAPYVAPVAIWNWTGFYAGVNAGYGWNTSRWNAAGVPGFASFNTNGDGFVGGAHAGFNWQFGSIVAGLEGMINFTDVGGSSQCSTFAGTTCRTRQNWLGDINVKLGVPIDRALIYATGGVAFTDYKFTQPVGVPPLPNWGPSSRTGWTLGAGIDYAINNNWIAGLQYKYYDFGSSTATSAGTAVRFRETENVILARLSYKFSWPGAGGSGVVARY